MITFKGESYMWGVCQLCRLSGLIRKKYVVGPGQVNDTSIPELDVCITCFHTPSGILSDNQTHKKLPAEEYLVK